MENAILLRTFKNKDIPIVQEADSSTSDVISQKVSTQLLAPREHLHCSYYINTGYFIKNQLAGVTNLSKIVRIKYNSSSSIYYGMFNSRREKLDGVYKYTYKIFVLSNKKYCFSPDRATFMRYRLNFLAIHEY